MPRIAKAWGTLGRLPDKGVLLQRARRLRERLSTLWPVASLRTYLALIMLIATAPVVALMGYQVFRSIEAHEQGVWRELERGAASGAQSVERELQASIDMLTLLGDGVLAAGSDSAELDRTLRQAAPRRKEWRGLFLLDAQGRLLVDTELPAPLDAAAVAQRPFGADTLAPLLEAGRPVVSGLLARAAGPAVAVAVPLGGAGRARLVLGAWVDPGGWQELLQDSATPADGFAVLLDRQHTVLGQTGSLERFVGRRLPEPTAPSDSSAAGLKRIDGAEDGPIYRAWRTVPASGWVLSVSVPATPMDVMLREALVSTSIGAVLCVLLGVYFAFLVARHLVEPLSELARPSQPEASSRIVVREVAALRDALVDAHARDQSARRRLQATAAEFEALFDSSPCGLAFAQDRQCRVVTRNSAMERLFGPADGGPADAAQVLHQGLPLPPEEQPLRRAAASGQPVPPLELEIVLPGEPVRHVLAQAVPLLDAHGEPRGAIGAYVDITDRVLGDERLQSAVLRLRESQHLVDLAQDAGHVGFFHYHFRQDEINCTQGQARLFGLGDDPALRTDPGRRGFRAWARHIRRADRLALEARLRNMLADRLDKETLEYRVVLPDGDSRWLSSRVLVIYGLNGSPEQMIGVSFDVNDEKLAQRERSRIAALERSARLEAEAASRAKDEFLAMLGHELRNPLSAIAAAIEVLNRVPGESELAGNARNIVARQTRHLAHMMDDLLDVGRVISGKVLLVRRPIDLAALARRVVSTFEVIGETKKHQLRLDLNEAWVDADATRLEQVLANLITNALKYTPAGSEISIRVVHEGSMALLEVRDNGPGIPAALLSRIFDLFVQGERPMDRRAGGLGIGLTLARRLIELHDGSVHAHNADPGAVFEVRLPATNRLITIGADTRSGEARGRRVVLIEDNEDALQGLRATLELDGHSVVAARDGPSGLRAVIDSRPDVAIVDIGLPGMTGLEVAKRSRAAGYGGLMIALSGYGRGTDVQQAFASGFDLHLVKPVDASELQRLMAEA